jgi:hypothetical protein
MTRLSDVLNYLKPNADYVIRGSELEWLDNNQSKPTEAEIEAGWVAYQAAQEAEAATKAAQRQALLTRLGITEDEARLLLG